MPVAVLVDKDTLQIRLLSDLLSNIGYSLVHVSDVWQGLVTAHKVRPDLIIIDDTFPQLLDFLVLVRATRGLSMTAILLLGVEYPSRYHVSKLGVSVFVRKPFDADAFIQGVYRADPTRPDAASQPPSASPEPSSL